LGLFSGSLSCPPSLPLLPSPLFITVLTKATPERGRLFFCCIHINTVNKLRNAYTLPITLLLQHNNQQTCRHWQDSTNL
jgi:hypothetical protein